MDLQQVKRVICQHSDCGYFLVYCQLLNVDLSHIEARVAKLLKRDDNLTLLQGQLLDGQVMHVPVSHLRRSSIFSCLLFSRSYIDRLCEEINDTLQEAGQVSIADLSRNLGLPTDFLLEVCSV